MSLFLYYTYDKSSQFLTLHLVLSCPMSFIPCKHIFCFHSPLNQPHISLLLVIWFSELAFSVSLPKLHCFVHVTFFHTITLKCFFSAAPSSRCFSLPMSQASLLTITSKNLSAALAVIFSVLLLRVPVYFTSTHFISCYLWFLQASSSWATAGPISQQLSAHFLILLSQLSYMHVTFACSTIPRAE